LIHDVIYISKTKQNGTLMSHLTDLLTAFHSQEVKNSESLRMFGGFQSSLFIWLSKKTKNWSILTTLKPRSACFHFFSSEYKQETELEEAMAVDPVDPRPLGSTLPIGKSFYSQEVE
jgi:hypothetical protein